MRAFVSEFDAYRWAENMFTEAAGLRDRDRLAQRLCAGEAT